VGETDTAGSGILADVAPEDKEGQGAQGQAQADAASLMRAG